MEPTCEAKYSREAQENLYKEELFDSSNKYQQSNRKVEILLKATGDAPIMKTKKWNVESDRTVASIIKFMKSYLKLSPGDNLFVYVNQSFAPSPDQIMQNLFECFGSDGKLVLHYSKTPAWG